MEQGTGIEPAFTAWEAVVLPIYEPCIGGIIRISSPFCRLIVLKTFYTIPCYAKSRPDPAMSLSQEKVCHSERSDYRSEVEESTHYRFCKVVFRCEDPSTPFGRSG